MSPSALPLTTGGTKEKNICERLKDFNMGVADFRIYGIRGLEEACDTAEEKAHGFLGARPEG